MKVLVVEDESSIRKFITINLNRDGFIPLEAGSGEEAIKIYNLEKPKVAILDVMLPGIDGFEVLQNIRKSGEDTIVIMLTARGQDMDKVMGLDLGADDYMVKPFNPLELVARIRAILRRTDKGKERKKETIIFKELTLDETSQKFFKNEVEIELTPREFSMMKAFMENMGTALSRDELLNMVWGQDYFGDVKTVDVHVRRLREKIEDNPSEPKYIQTVWGIGYRFIKG